MFGGFTNGRKSENNAVITNPQIKNPITKLNSSNTNQIGKEFAVNKFDVSKMLKDTNLKQ